MSAPLVFMDTETTGLSLDDDIWEFAAIRRELDGTQVEHHIFIEHSRDKCAQLPTSFRDDHYNRYLDHKAYSTRQAASYIEDIFRRGKPHVVGAVPNFDTERVARLVGQHSRIPLGWHYHLIDVENLAVGYLAGLLGEAKARSGDKSFAPNPAYVKAITPPWKSDDLAAALGVTIPEDERHTAMGDARWAMRIYDAVMAAT